jgi:trigger factor
MLHSLSHQGIDKETYLRIADKTEEEILQEAKPDAEQGLRRESVIAAIVEAEGLEASDGDILDALSAAATREGTEPEKLRAQLEKNGRLDELKDDLAQRMAVDLVAEQAKAVAAPALEDAPAEEKPKAKAKTKAKAAAKPKAKSAAKPKAKKEPEAT